MHESQSMPQTTWRVAVIQMVSGVQLERNLQRAQGLIAEAAQRGVEAVILPEYFCLMGQNDHDKYRIREACGHGEIQRCLSEWAQAFGVWIFGGTLPLESGVLGKVFNSLLVYAPTGECMARYDKIHLFGLSGLGERYAEADSIVAGSQPQTVMTPFGRVGLGVCYDVRFPELFRGMGAVNALVLPAAFTAVTGAAHWHILLRARAIENQCYVLAAAQGGEHENGRRTYGHSMVIDPWGDIVAECADGEGVIDVALSVSRVQSVRTRLPALKHRVL